MRIGVRPYNCRPKSLPIGGRQPAKFGDNLKTVQSISVCTAMDRLDLQERIFVIELDRDIGPSQTDICKQRSKPSVGFDDALVMFVSLTARQVHGRADKQAPFRGGACDKPAPDLDNTRLLEGCKK